MTVQELIDQLRHFDPNMDVVVDDITGSGSLEEPDLQVLTGPSEAALLIRTPSQVQASAELRREQVRALD